MKRAARVRFDSAVARLNAWSFLYLQGDRPVALGRLRMPNAALLPKIFINPDKLAFKCNIRGDDEGQRKLFLAGDWDLKRKGFADVDANDPRYVTCRQLIRDAAPLEETAEYRELMLRLRKHGVARSFRSEKEILGYLEKLRQFYLRVQADGRLKTQAELGLAAHGGEINCALGRDGVLLKTNDGNHRLAIARVLGLASVPIQISVIHASLIPEVAAHDPASGTAAINAFLEKIERSHC
ncbi:MAG: hypothetical protein F9K30_00585 [Dechloromonas sp.]|nr:MAG: hypothetical protein F9K30_00585 [Dechloromonas sp.]